MNTFFFFFYKLNEKTKVGILLNHCNAVDLKKELITLIARLSCQVMRNQYFVL